MKRSKMVGKIASVLINFSLTDRVEALRVANVILEIQEEAGMKPPYSADVFEEEAKIYIYPDGNQWDSEE